jgi:hypothetical protein
MQSVGRNSLSAVAQPVRSNLPASCALAQQVEISREQAEKSERQNLQSQMGRYFKPRSYCPKRPFQENTKKEPFR